MLQQYFALILLILKTDTVSRCTHVSIVISRVHTQRNSRRRVFLASGGGSAVKKFYTAHCITLWNDMTFIEKRAWAHQHKKQPTPSSSSAAAAEVKLQHRQQPMSNAPPHNVKENHYRLADLNPCTEFSLKRMQHPIFGEPYTAELSTF